MQDQEVLLVRRCNVLQFDQNRHLVAPKLLSNNNLSSATTICGKCTGSVPQTRSGLYWLCLSIGQVIVDKWCR